MNLHVWWDPPADGPSNMAADEALADEALARGGCCLRLYGWTPTTVSLGGFQRGIDAAAEASIAGVPLVRRPSGGGAIVHGSDLTYAAAVPRSHPWGGRPQSFYDALHEALCRALEDFGVAATLWPQAGGAALPSGRDDGAFFCFDRRSSGDVVVGVAESPDGRGHKILGSAQRRLAAAVLQHGSLLVRRNRDVTGGASHPGLDGLAPHGFPGAQVPSLAERWLELVAVSLGAPLAREAGRFIDERSVSERAARFTDPRWTHRR